MTLATEIRSASYPCSYLTQADENRSGCNQYCDERGEQIVGEAAQLAEEKDAPEGGHLGG